jgi:hypothetical protein
MRDYKSIESLMVSLLILQMRLRIEQVVGTAVSYLISYVTLARGSKPVFNFKNSK